MDGFDIQKYNTVIKKLEELGLDIELRGEVIRLYRSGDNRKYYGGFLDVDILYHFLCGYEWGRNEIT